MRRILFLNHTIDLEAGGAERVLLDILNGLDRSRFQPVLAVPAERIGASQELQHARVETRLLPPFPVGRSAGRLELARVCARLVRLNLALLRLIRADRPDAVYVNSVFSLHFAALTLGVTRVPLIFHEHGLPQQRQGSYWNLIFPWLAKRASFVVAISEAVRRGLIDLGLPPARIVTVHNGIDPEPPSSEPSAPLPRNMTGPGFVIGQVANFHPWKGHDTLLRAMARLRERLPEARCVIFGSPSVPDCASDIAQMIHDLQLSQSVELGGFRTDVQALYSRLDCLVLASRGEPFGLVLLEAMRADVPVIAARAGGVPEIVDHGENGLLFAPDDDAELAACIERLATDSALRARLIAGGRESVRTRFSLSKQVQGIESVLEAAVARGSLSP